MGEGHWRIRSLVTAGAALVLMGTLTETAWAMGVPDSNTSGMDVLAPNTITVEGVAAQAITDPVNDITYSMTITDTSVKAEMKDAATLEQHLRTALKQDGIANGNILFSVPSFADGSSGPQTTLQLNVIVPKSSQVPNVVASLGSYEPNFLQNNYMSEQVVPLNPESLWPKLYQAALDNARSQATTLASEAGVQLGSIVAISTVLPSGVVQPVSGPYPSSVPVAGMQLVYNNGNQVGQVMAQLYVTFAIDAPNS